MIPIKVSNSTIKIRDSNGEFKQITVGASNLGTTVNINDNADGSNSTWSSNKLRQEILSVLGQIEDSSAELENKINNSKTWSVQIESTQGGFIDSPDYKSILIAHLFFGPDEVTDRFDDSCFEWKRVSTHPDDDVIWNLNHSGRSKQLEITDKDTYDMTDTYFDCYVYYGDYLLATTNDREEI